MVYFRNITFFLAFVLFCSSCNSSSTNEQENKEIFGVYEADWTALRFYLYPDSTFYEVTGKINLINDEFEGSSTNTTYDLKNPAGFGKFTVLKEGENSIIKFNYSQLHGVDMTISSRHKIENDGSFYSLNENQIKESFDKVGGMEDLIKR